MGYEYWKKRKMSCGHNCMCAEARYTHAQNMAYWERLNAEIEANPLGGYEPTLSIAAMRKAEAARKSRKVEPTPEEIEWLAQAVTEPTYEEVMERVLEEVPVL